MKDSLKKEWQSIASRVPSLRGTRQSPQLFLMGGLLLLASYLCLLSLGHLSLDFDEAVSIVYSQVDWKSLWKVLADDPNMSLYYGLLHFWVTLNGTSEFGARSLSVIPAVATVPLLYSLAARLLGSRAALISCLLLTLNTFFIQFAQEARSYSLVLFLITLSSLLF